MRAEVRANGRTVVASGVAILLAGEMVWDLSIEDLTYRFTFAPSVGQPQAEHVSTVGKHAEMRIVGGSGSWGVGIHLPGLAILNGIPHNLSFSVSTIGDDPTAMRSVSYSITR